MTKQAVELNDLTERVAQDEAAIQPPVTPDEAPPPTPVPQAAWETLERLQLAAQVSHQQLQAFVDGLALGQGVAQGVQLTQMPQGGWAWVPGEHARRE